VYVWEPRRPIDELFREENAIGIRIPADAAYATISGNRQSVYTAKVICSLVPCRQVKGKNAFPCLVRWFGYRSRTTVARSVPKWESRENTIFRIFGSAGGVKDPEVCMPAR